MCILTIGKPFRYTLPTFDVLAVELRRVLISGYEVEGGDERTRTYDAFIRNDPSLTRSYPTWMVVKDSTFVDVSCCSLQSGVV